MGHFFSASWVYVISRGGVMTETDAFVTRLVTTYSGQLNERVAFMPSCENISDACFLDTHHPLSPGMTLPTCSPSACKRSSKRTGITCCKKSVC